MYDLLIHNARVVDGTGAPAFTSDIAVTGNRIVALQQHITEAAQQVLDADGQVVAPGFVDAHTHDDLAILRGSTVQPKVQQGITTVVIGNCGFSMAPMVPAYAHEVKDYSAPVLGVDKQPWNWRTMGAFLDELRAIPLGQNVRALLGQGPLRVAVMGFERRDATEQEIITQEELIAEAMQAGAAGISLGLAYVPGGYTPTTELARLGRVVGRYGGVVASHMRTEGSDVLDSIKEMIAIAEQGEVAVHLSHLKVVGRENWGSMQRAIDLINDARVRGLDVTVDVYPYNAGSTTITQLLPPWLKEGGVASMLERLRDPQTQKQVRQDITNGLPGWENPLKGNGWESIYLASVQTEQNKALEGKNLLEASESLGLSPEDTLFRLVLEEQGQITMIMFSMDDRDVDKVVSAPFSMIGSDGLPILSGRPHPRLYGTFPRFIKRYVRELKSLTLEQAVYKASTFACERFRIADRGVIAENKVADLVIFDPATISDKATYDNPHMYPDGIAAVIVAGQPVVLHGQLQERTPGQLITSASKSTT